MPLTALNLSGCAIGDLSVLKGMPLNSLSINGCRQLREFAPLRDLPLRSLTVWNCAIGPETLRGMSLELLNIRGDAQVDDLAVLEGMPLKEIHFTPRLIRKGMGTLRGMKTLEVIHVSGGVAGRDEQRFEPAEFWARYDKGEFRE